jgi:uridine kinase
VDASASTGLTDAEEQLHLFTLPEGHKVAHIIKRDGRWVAFNRLKIVNAIYRAALAVGGDDRRRAESLADEVVRRVGAEWPAGATPSVEDVQDAVEKTLMARGHARTAKAFILYRAERARVRAAKPPVGPVDDNIPYKVLWRVFNWNVDHACHTLAALNERQGSPDWPRLIADAEAAYHQEVDHVVDLIRRRCPEIRLVIVAGPSSSGKTTTTMKIGERLAARGHPFVTWNLDDYFKPLALQPRDEYGDYDFEMPDALDLPLINDHLGALLDGREVRTPIYNFKTGRREEATRAFRLRDGELLLVDSLHGLFSGLTRGVPPESMFKFYIEALCQVKDADGEFVRWTDLRLLRRMVRDSWHRSYDPAMTVGHWHYVRKSEKRYIVPFLTRADYIFNGALPYELPYHAARLTSLLPGIQARFRDDPKKDDAYRRAQRLARLLASVRPAASEADVPADSLLREFIGGSRYAY